MRILLLSPVDPAAVEALAEEHHVDVAIGAGPADVARRIGDADVVVLRSGVSLDGDVLGRALRLGLIIRAGCGTDNIAMDVTTARGIRVETIPEPGGEAVAEMTFALLLSLLRNVPLADRMLRAGRWEKHELTGHSLMQRTLGIVGAGNIGTRVGALAAAWGIPTLGCVEVPDAAARRRLARAGIDLVSFDEVIERADVVSLHVPLTPATRHLIDRAVLRRMRPGSYLAHLARGGVVDEEALHDALVSGHLAGAAVDVHTHEGAPFRSRLTELDNVVLTPHIGAGTVEARQRIGRRVCELVESHRAVADLGAVS